jgi:hypothetical protein
MDMLLSSAFAVTLFSVSLFFFRMLMMLALLGILGFYLCFLRALRREFSRTHPARNRIRHILGLSSRSVNRRLRHLDVSQGSLHDVSHREDSVDVAMTDD